MTIGLLVALMSMGPDDPMQSLFTPMEWSELLMRQAELWAEEAHKRGEISEDLSEDGAAYAWANVVVALVEALNAADGVHVYE